VNLLGDLGPTIGAIALTLPRLAAAFLVLPLLSAATMPSLVRNSFLVSLAILVYPLAMGTPAQALQGALWPFLVVKELFIGVCFGFLFGSVFWAVSAAGNLIDTKVGTNFAAVADPIQGHETSLTGQLLTQLVAWLFMASGAFTLFLNLLMTSYTLWPVNDMLPPLTAATEQIAIGEFSALLTLALMLAAPALVVASLLDLSLGLINRYAPQLNVFSLTLSIKAWVATFVVMLSLGTCVDIVTQKLFANRGILNLLRQML
jgi:type III secretion protein T